MYTIKYFKNRALLNHAYRALDFVPDSRKVLYKCWLLVTMSPVPVTK